MPQKKPALKLQSELIPILTNLGHSATKKQTALLFRARVTAGAMLHQQMQRARRGRRPSFAGKARVVATKIL